MRVKDMITDHKEHTAVHETSLHELNLARVMH